MSAPTAPGALDAWLADRHDELVGMRRAFHANPELSGEEHETTDEILSCLRLAGLQPERLTVGTGAVCDIAGAEPGPTIALRADIDALAMDDRKQVAYRSRHDGVAHACGHDVHTTVALGAATYLADHRDEFAGTVRLIFQPAEERMPGGALDVLADDALAGVDAIVGLHCEPKSDCGTIGLRAGAITSASDRVHVVLQGPGGHTARPELTVDLVAVTARLVAELGPEIARELGEAPFKLVFGAVRGGNAGNVIPTRCELTGTMRTPSLDAWETLPGVVERAVARVLADTGAEHHLDYSRGVPPVVNDEAVIDMLTNVVDDEFEPGTRYEPEQSWGGDDFAWLTREVPGAYVRLGVHDPDSDLHLDLHAGSFDVDERSIAIGVRLLVATVRRFCTVG